MKRLWRLVRWPILLVGIAGVALWTGTNIAGSRRLREAIARVDASGIPLDALPLPPDRVDIGPSMEEILGAYDVPSKAVHVSVLSSYLHEGIRPLTAEQAQDLDDYLAGQAKPLAGIAKLVGMAKSAWNGPDLRNPEEFTPRQRKVMSLMQCLAVRSERSTAAGTREAALEDIRTLLLWVRAMDLAPTWYLQSLRGLAARLATRAIDSLVDRATPTEVLGQLSELLPPERAMSRVLATGTRSHLETLTRNLRKRPYYYAEHFSGGPDRALVWIFARLQVPSVKLEGARMLDRLLRAVEVSEKPLWEAAPELNWLDDESSTGCFARFAPLSWWHRQAAAFQSHIEVTRAGLAVEAARLRTGRYPDSVGVVDPWTGLPLRIEHGAISSGNGVIQWPSRLGTATWKLRQP